MTISVSVCGGLRVTLRVRSVRPLSLDRDSDCDYSTDGRQHEFRGVERAIARTNRNYHRIKLGRWGGNSSRTLLRRSQRGVGCQEEAKARRGAGAIREVNGQVEICAGDASEDNTAQRAVELAMRRFGGVGILVNNAGQGSYKPFIETSPAEYDDLMRANVRSSFLFSRAVAAHMIEARSGVIIFVSSVAGLAGQANEVAYSTTKFAQVGMAQSLAEELRGYGVKVCALCPGGVKTEFAIGRGRTRNL